MTRIRELNTEYDCCGRIIPVMLCFTKTSKSESDIHLKLKKYLLNKDERIINNTTHRELYQISPELYDKVNELFSKSCKKCKLWESSRYVLGDDYGETFDEDILSGDEEETKFWHNKIFGVVSFFRQSSLLESVVSNSRQSSLSESVTNDDVDEVNE